MPVEKKCGIVNQGSQGKLQTDAVKANVGASAVLRQMRKQVKVLDICK